MKRTIEMVEKIRYYYNNGFWNENRVYNVVGLAITEADYEEITGEKYIKAGDTNE